MSNTSPLNIVVAAGGTGGHIFPAVAVVERLVELTENNINVTFMGSYNRMEAQLIPEYGYRFIGMNIKGLGRIFSVDTLVMPLRVLRSIVKAYTTLRKQKAQVVICTGAYISFPVGIAAWLSGIPLVVFESNVNPGKSNKRLASKASAIVLAFEASKKFFSSEVQRKLICLGNPIRRGVTNAIGKEEARASLKLSPDTNTLLVFGGSLGAKAINQATEKFIANHSDIQVIWQTGKNYTPPSNLPPNVVCMEFISDMGLVYAAADVVLCRSGATTIAELAVLGKPSILVPLPSASTNEQFYNARHAQSVGGALMIENQILIEQMETAVLDILEDTERLLEMGEAIKKLGRPNAARDSAELVLEIARWNT